MNGLQRHSEGIKRARFLLPGIAATLLLGVLILAGSQAAAQSKDSVAQKAASAPAGKAENGKTIYMKLGCWECHGRDAQSGRPTLGPAALPFAAFTFVIASAASMGIPGFSGFAAEITILIGAWKTFPIAVWITGAGMVLVAAFTLRALKKSFLGDAVSSVRMQEGRVQVDPDWNEQSNSMPPITVPEKWGACLLIFATLAIGLYPKLLLDRIQPAVEAMRFLK